MPQKPTLTTDIPDLAALPPDPEQARRAQEASGTDVIGGVADTVELGGILVDAATLAVQAGGLAVEAGATTIKVAATGIELVGSVVGGIFDAF